MTTPQRRDGPGELQAALVALMTTSARGSGKRARSRVRTFSEHVGGPREWEQLGLERQLGLSVAERTVATWLLASGRARTTPEYLLRAPIFLGPVFSRCHPRFREAFAETAARIGMTRPGSGGVGQGWRPSA